MRSYFNLFSAGTLAITLTALSACTETDYSREAPEAKKKTQLGAREKTA